MYVIRFEPMMVQIEIAPSFGGFISLRNPVLKRQ